VADQVGEGDVGGQVEPAGDVGGALGPVLSVAGGDDGEGGGQCPSGWEVVESFVDEGLGEWLRLGQEGLQRAWAMAGEGAGGVLAGGEGDVSGVAAAGGEHPVVPFGGELSGEVAVGGDDDTARAGEVGGQGVGLGVGEGGAEGGDADVVVAVAGQGYREDVDGSFDEDGGGAAGEPVGVLGDAVQLVALGV